MFLRVTIQKTRTEDIKREQENKSLLALSSSGQEYRKSIGKILPSGII